MKRSLPEAGDALLFDIRHLWQAGVLLQDRNGDGIVDSVDVSIALPSYAQAEALCAAANIAARIGFETTAMDLPLPDAGGRVHFEIEDNFVSGLAGGLIELEDGDRGYTLTLRARDAVSLHQAGMFVASLTEEQVDFLARAVAISFDPYAHISALHLCPLGMPVALELSAQGTAFPAEYRARLKAEIDRADGVVVAFERDRAFCCIVVPREADGAHHQLREKPQVGAGDFARFFGAGGPFATEATHPIAGNGDLVLCPARGAGRGVIDLAARIGLEASSLTLPVALTPEQMPIAEGGMWVGETAPRLPVLLGRDHPHVAGKCPRSDTARAEIIPRAFRYGSEWFPAIAVSEETASGEGLTKYMARTMPHVSGRRKGDPEIADVARSIAHLLEGRSPLGQAAWALHIVDRFDLSEIADAGALELAVERPDPKLAALASEALADAGLSLPVHVYGRHAGDPADCDAGSGVNCDIVLDPEVDHFKSLFTNKILPLLTGREEAGLSIAAELGESPEIRAELRDWIAEQLPASLVGKVQVRILCSYKAGLSWLMDHVAPQLSEMPVHSIEIECAEHSAPPEFPYQSMHTESRWLCELYPADEMLALHLGMDVRHIRMNVVSQASETYRVIARDAAGASLAEMAFSPRTVVRPLIDAFPDYEMVRVVTGGVTVATADGEVLFDRRIASDMERFWDHYQSVTLPALRDYVLAMTKGNPDPQNAPFFRELRVELALSEPDFRMGPRQEVVSAIDAVHEEIYLSTRRFLEVLGQRIVGKPLRYAGRIIPVVRATGRGEPQRCRIDFAGFEHDRPCVRLQAKAGKARTAPLPKKALDHIRAIGLEMHPQDGLSITFAVSIDDRADDPVGLRNSTYLPVGDPTAAILSEGQLRSLLAKAQSLLDQGLYHAEFRFAGLHSIILADHTGTRIGTLCVPRANAETAVDAQDPAPPIDWDMPIGPDAAHAIMAEIAQRPEATLYTVGQSYLGRSVDAMDLMAPIASSHVSRLKLSITKPTLLLFARQHANEVSGTTHSLLLARELAGGGLRHLLDRANVVVLPILNADGAALLDELKPLSENGMLHAAYFGALGDDIGFGSPGDNPIMPESSFVPALWHWWLPDAVLNPHGCPAHEWVMPFSEYQGWAMSRTRVIRQFWIPRGWFMPDVLFPEGPRFAGHRQVAGDILGRIAHAQRECEAAAADEAQRAVYRRYTVDIDAENHQLHVEQGVAFYHYDPLGKAGAGGWPLHHWMTSHPDITIWQGITEAPDEVVTGDQLRKVSAQGLAWSTAVLEHLHDNRAEARRIMQAMPGGEMRMTIARQRPGLAAVAANGDF